MSLRKKLGNVVPAKLKCFTVVIAEYLFVPISGLISILITLTQVLALSWSQSLMSYNW